MGCGVVSYTCDHVMVTKTETSVRKRSYAPIVGSVLFALAFGTLLLNGGWCERYEQKMRRMEMRKQALQPDRGNDR